MSTTIRKKSRQLTLVGNAASGESCSKPTLRCHGGFGRGEIPMGVAYGRKLAFIRVSTLPCNFHSSHWQTALHFHLGNPDNAPIRQDGWTKECDPARRIARGGNCSSLPATSA